MPSFRHNGRTFSIETPEAPHEPGRVHCVVFGPYFGQHSVAFPQATVPGGPIHYLTFDSPDSAVEHARQYILGQLGQQESFLKCFMNQLKEHEMFNPLSEKLLRIHPTARADWRKLTQHDWETDEWAGTDQNLTSLHVSDEIHLDALKRRLRRVGVMGIEVTGDVDYMEIVQLPAD